eukprot:Em0020g870a
MPGDKSDREKHFSDKDVCRPYLLGICINDLFINTRAEIGDCTKVHSVTFKEAYAKASQKRDYHFEEEVLEYLRSFVKDNERKIEGNKKRLELADENPEMQTKSQEIHELAVQIGEKVAKAEALGAEGKVDESLALMTEVETIKEKKKVLEDEYHALIPRHAVQQQKLRACEVCGAFLSMYDNDRRLADHFGGKLHIGFVTIRDKMKQLEDAIQQKQEKRLRERDEYQKEREKKPAGRYQGRDERKDRERDGYDHSDYRGHSREQDRRRSRSRSRERSREKSKYSERDSRPSRDSRRRSDSRERRRSRSRSGSR